MSNTTKVIFIIGILLLIYGYLCRFLNIYFFWDSKHFGWIIMAIGLMGFFIDLRKILKAQGKNIWLVRVGIAIIILALGIEGGATILLKTSDAYETIKEEMLKPEGMLKSEIGAVKGFGFFPSGIGVLTIALNADPGPATFIITVKGSKAYRDIEITLQRSSAIEWTAVSSKPVYY